MIILVPNVSAQEATIPAWIKNNADWWTSDQIDDNSFVSGIQWLVSNDIIQVQPTMASDISESEIPDWLVNNAGWWAARIFTNSDFSFDPEYVKEKIYTSVSRACLGGIIVTCPEVTYNSLGFRGNELEKEKPDNTFRIFAVGGSTTFGRGIADTETWPVYLQQIINEKITDKDIQVINAGIPQATSGQEYDLIKDKLSSLGPDLIITYDGWNDSIYHDVKTTIQNWEHICKLGKDEGFSTIIIVQPMAATGERVLTEQEIVNSSPMWIYLQKFQQYVDGFKELESCSKTIDFRSIFDYVQAPVFFDRGHTLGLGNKIIAENVFSTIAPTYFGKMYESVDSNLQKNESETGVVYAVGSDLSGKNFDGLNLRNAVFDKANLSNTSFNNADVDGARFVFANLNNSNLFDRIDLSNINLAGTNLSNVNLKGKNLSGTILTGADLSGANLTGVDLSGKDLTETILTGANLSDTNLAGVDLYGKDLTGTILTGADLSDMDLAGTILAGSDISDTNLDGVNLSGVNLSGMDLSGVDLYGAILAGANLSVTNLAGVDLSGKDLTGTRLVGADLTNAVLTGTILTGADLTNAVLTGTILNCVDHPVCV